MSGQIWLATVASCEVARNHDSRIEAGLLNSDASKERGNPYDDAEHAPMGSHWRRIGWSKAWVLRRGNSFLPCEIPDQPPPFVAGGFFCTRRGRLFCSYHRALTCPLRRLSSLHLGANLVSRTRSQLVFIRYLHGLHKPPARHESSAQKSENNDCPSFFVALSALGRERVCDINSTQAASARVCTTVTGIPMGDH